MPFITKVKIGSTSYDIKDANLVDALDVASIDFLRQHFPESKESGGVAWTVNTNGSIKVQGATGDTQTLLNIYSSSSSLPTWLKAGTTYYVDFSATNVSFEIYYYEAGNAGATKFLSTSGRTTITIPSGWIGCIIRLRVGPNITVNETVWPRVTKHISNALLDRMNLEGNYGTATSSDQNITSCNNITHNSVYFISINNGTASISDGPGAIAGWVKTTLVGSGSNSQAILQMFYPYSSTSRTVYARKRNTSGVWGDWVTVGNGGGTNTYNVTQNISRDEHNNTYNITTSPQITTDSHGWLSAVDNESTTQANATDMSGAIMSMLNDTGYCHLGEGTFYVSGNIAMPSGSTLVGCGDKTIVRLLNSVDSGYIVQPRSTCTIKDITFHGGTGAPSALNTVGADFGSRHGIYFVANADGNTNHSITSGYGNVIENCRFRYFNGSAIYMANTGGNTRGVVTASNLHIRDCMVGINIDYYSEYNKFMNSVIVACNHACINNGGNNVFVGCTFHGVVGFLIDNSGSDKSNNAHGTCSSCTFNHIDNTNRASTLGGGDGVLIKGATNGFLFDSCQIWYGAINIDNSRGIAFNGCLIGGDVPNITITGSYPAFFSNCVFHSAPDIIGTSGTKFNNCYMDSNGAAIIF